MVGAGTGEAFFGPWARSCGVRRRITDEPREVVAVYPRREAVAGQIGGDVGGHFGGLMGPVAPPWCGVRRRGGTDDVERLDAEATPGSVGEVRPAEAPARLAPGESRPPCPGSSGSRGPRWPATSNNYRRAGKNGAWSLAALAPDPPPRGGPHCTASWSFWPLACCSSTG